VTVLLRRAGAAFPLPGRRAAARVSLALTAIALAGGEMVVGCLTGRPVLRSGLRQLALGGVAIAITFLVGHLIGSHGG
jgi:vacuolar iron transporter family protein